MASSPEKSVSSGAKGGKKTGLRPFFQRVIRGENITDAAAQSLKGQSTIEKVEATRKIVRSGVLLTPDFYWD